MGLSTRSAPRRLATTSRASAKPKQPSQIGHEEDDHQALVFDYMKLAYFKYYDGSLRPVTDYFFAIPNGGKRNKLEAIRLKRQGVKAGVCDMLLAVPFRERCGLWIELKVGKNKPQKNQLEFIDNMVDVGYLAMVVWGWKDVVRSVEAYLGGLYTQAGIRLRMEDLR